MIQIKDSNSLAYVNENEFNLIDLSEKEENIEEKIIKTIKLDNEEHNLFYDIIQINDEILFMQKNKIILVNLKNNYSTNYIDLNKEFYSMNIFNSISLLPNNQILAWSREGELLKIDPEKKEILQKFKVDAKSKSYFSKILNFKNKYLIFSGIEKLYEIKYDEKEEVKNYEEIKLKITKELFMKEQDNIVKKIIEEKDIKEVKDERVTLRAPKAFYHLYRYKSLKKEFPTYTDGQIFDLCMKEYQLLKQENREFFKDLSKKDYSDKGYTYNDNIDKF